MHEAHHVRNAFRAILFQVEAWRVDGTLYQDLALSQSARTDT